MRYTDELKLLRTVTHRLRERARSETHVELVRSLLELADSTERLARRLNTIDKGMIP
jgi:hypothetical protein